MRRIAATVLATGLLAGCGETPEPTFGGAVEVPATVHQATALTHVVADFDRAYRRGDGKAVCALMTPLSQRFLVDSMASASRGATCAEVAVGDERPPAAEEASGRRFRGFTISPDGGGATINFADCRRWRLVRQGDAWLIEDFPVIPRSLRDVGRDCAATDRPTA